MASESKSRLFCVQWYVAGLQHPPFLKGDIVSCEPFTIPALGFTRWRMELYPEGRESSLETNNLTLYLRRLPSESVHYEYSYKDEVVVSTNFIVNAELRIEREPSRREHTLQLFREIHILRDELDPKEGSQSGEEQVIEVKKPKLEETRTEYKMELRDKSFKIFDVYGTDINIGVLNKDFPLHGSLILQIKNEFFLGSSKHLNGISDYLSLSNDLKELFDSQEHFDLVLSCEGREFKVHRGIIACRAPQLLTLWGLDARSGVEILTVNISNIPFHVLQTILVFIYTGATDIRPSQATEELVHIAVQYGLKDLLRKTKPFPNNIRTWSTFRTETKTVQFWPLRKGDGINECILVQEVRLDSIYCDTLVITCYLPPDYIRRRHSQIKISLSFVGFSRTLPIELVVYVMCPNEGMLNAPLNELNEIASYRYLLSEEGEYTQIVDISLDSMPPSLLTPLEILVFMSDGETDPPVSYSLGDEDTCICDFFKLVQDFSRLFDEQLHTDFKIICKGEEFNVHRCILAARSKYFHALLDNGSKESQEGVVYINDISPKNMNIFLNYLYKNSFPRMALDNVAEIYVEADKCPMETLKSKCREELIENMNAEIFFDIQALARSYSDGLLVEFCNQWSRKQTVTLIKCLKSFHCSYTK